MANDDDRARQSIAVRRQRLITIDALLLVAAFVFAVLAVGAGFWAYFTLGGEAPDPTPTELAVLDVFAAASVLASVAAFVLAVVLRGRWGALFGVVSALAVVGAIVLAVSLVAPQGGPTTDDGPALPTNYEPCYSGSNTCN